MNDVITIIILLLSCCVVTSRGRNFVASSEWLPTFPVISSRRSCFFFFPIFISVSTITVDAYAADNYCSSCKTNNITTIITRFAVVRGFSIPDYRRSFGKHLSYSCFNTATVVRCVCYICHGALLQLCGSAALVPICFRQLFQRAFLLHPQFPSFIILLIKNKNIVYVETQILQSQQKH